MKFLLAFCLILVSGVRGFGGGSFDPELYEIIIREWAECARGALTDGIPELEFPSFNPLHLKDRHFQMVEAVFGGNFEVRNVYLDGLQKFELAQLEITTDPTTINYEVVINSTLRGEYEANGNTGMVNFDNGKGIFNFNTLLKVKGKVQLTEGGVEVQNVDTLLEALPNYTIEGIEGEIAKNWEAWILSINESQEEINAFLEPYLTKFGNSLLDLEASPELGEILELVMSKCP